jgi:cyclophilin family peptidyl-prolyl cis-trans isomerase
MSSGFAINTTCGAIKVALCQEAPVTAAHIMNIVTAGLYNGCCFYRSDFVIQMGLQTAAGAAVDNPNADLQVNESTAAGALGNTKGTLAVAHWDVPDCGNSEFFINLKDNLHLNAPTYGGYAVFARVGLDDSASWATVDAIAKAVEAGQKVDIESVTPF